MKLGVVLGSGAARGWAHIGVMNQLSAMGLKPDIVTGTSIGAVVGAAIASGRLSELETWVRGLTQWQVLSLLDWGLGKGGLLNGEKVFDKVAETLGDLSFSDLDLPFGAVAADLHSGRETWLTEGGIKQAIRCSCAIPGILAPSLYEGQWLVDGATVNPIPVNLCRAMGADFVIAVDLNSDKSHRQAKQHHVASAQAAAAEEEEQTNSDSQVLPEADVEEAQIITENETGGSQQPTPEGNGDDPLTSFGQMLINSKEYLQQLTERKSNDQKAPRMFAVMAGCIEIMQDRITRSRLAGEPPDVVIQPKLGRYGTMEFHRANELIAEGERCVQASQNILRYELEHFMQEDPEENAV